jgi:hypothetical protein
VNEFFAEDDDKTLSKINFKSLSSITIMNIFIFWKYIFDSWLINFNC